METPLQQSTPRPFWQHIAIGIGLLLVAAVLANFDVSIVRVSDPAEWPGDLRRVFKLSELFAHGFGILLIVLGIWHLTPQRRTYIPRLLSCVIFPSIVAHMIKLVVARRRPTSFLNEHMVPNWPDSPSATWPATGSEFAWNVQYASQSFPSAHAALVCGLAIGLSFIFPRGRTLFASVAVIAMMQRVIFFAHWPSDVAVGASLGFLIAGGLVQGWGIGWLCAKLESRGQSTLKIASVEEDQPRGRKAA